MHDARDPHGLENQNCAKRVCLDGQSPDSRTLRLTAVAADNPERLVRYLSGAVLACGGWILTRSTQGSHSAELDFEFARASCVEIYSVLVAAGLELSRDSHLQLADLCHCTRNLIESRALDIARVVITIYRSTSAPEQDDYAPVMAA